MKSHPLLLDRIVGRPHYVHPDRARVILHALRDHIGLDVEQPAPEASRFYGRPAQHAMFRVHNGAAIVPVMDTLVNRGAWLGTFSGQTSYEGITAQLRTAREDASVNRVVLDINSPGGEAGGMAALADAVRALNAEKPVTAVINDMAASAAYGIASAADRIVISPTSLVGSIGVVLVHTDFSAQLEKRGINATVIYAGAHKADGNPFEPLNEESLAELQATVNAYYDRFVEVVAAGRADMTSDDIRATEARVFVGRDAIDQGLADEVGTFDAVIAERRIAGVAGYRTSAAATAATVPDTLPTATAGPSLETERHQPPRAGATTADHEEKPAMSVKTEAAAPDKATGVPTETHNTAVKAAREQGEAEGRKAGAAAERVRIAAILSLDEAKGREAQARVIAFETDMSAEQAKPILAAGPAANVTPAPKSVADRAGGTMGLEISGAGEDARATRAAALAADLHPTAVYDNRRTNFSAQ